MIIDAGLKKKLHEMPDDDKTLSIFVAACSARVIILYPIRF
jgi:hypothetical protein